MATPADIRAADDWWASISDDRRVSTHRWLTGLTKKPPEPEPGLSLLGLLDEQEAEQAAATEESSEEKV